MKKGDVVRLAAATAVFGILLWAGDCGELKKPAGVVELFTSQGCSSCPPADAILEDLAKKGDVVALAYHVDYWDYLGWQDTLASPDNTARQYEYAKAFGVRSVYTPQAVINGTHPRQGFEPAPKSLRRLGNLPNRAKASASISR